MYRYKVKVLSGYRVTIPKEVRERWGLRVGDEVEVVVEGSRLILRPLKLPSDPVLSMLGLAEEAELRSAEDAVIEELKEKLERSRLDIR